MISSHSVFYWKDSRGQNDKMEKTPEFTEVVAMHSLNFYTVKRLCKEMTAIAAVVLVGCMLGSCVATDVSRHNGYYEQVVLVRYEKPNGRFSAYKRAYAVRMQNGVDFIWFQKESNIYEQKMVYYIVNGEKVNKVDVVRKTH